MGATPAEKNTTAAPAEKNTTAAPAEKNTTAEAATNNTIVKKVKNLIKNPKEAKEVQKKAEDANNKIKNATGVDVHNKAENFLKNAKKPIMAKRTTTNETKADDKASSFTKFSTFIMITLTALVL